MKRCHQPANGMCAGREPLSKMYGRVAISVLVKTSDGQAITLLIGLLLIHYDRFLDLV